MSQPRARAHSEHVASRTVREKQRAWGREAKHVGAVGPRVASRRTRAASRWGGTSGLDSRGEKGRARPRSWPVTPEPDGEPRTTRVQRRATRTRRRELGSDPTKAAVRLLPPAAPTCWRLSVKARPAPTAPKSEATRRDAAPSALALPPARLVPCCSASLPRSLPSGAGRGPRIVHRLRAPRDTPTLRAAPPGARTRASPRTGGGGPGPPAGPLFPLEQNAGETRPLTENRGCFL